MLIKLADLRTFGRRGERKRSVSLMVLVVEEISAASPWQRTSAADSEGCLEVTSVDIELGFGGARLAMQTSLTAKTRRS